MTRKEVIEGNKLIAEFITIGVNTETGWLHFRHPEIEAAPFNYEYYRFEESWDWLMPCIEKIELIEDDYYGRFIVYISSNNCTIQSTNFRFDKISVKPSHYFNSLYGNSKIEAVWVAIVEFIKWYNSCKKE